MENQNQQNPLSKWFQESLTAKMIIIGLLILVLLIPLAYVQNLIEERAERQQEVISEINEKWGKENTLYGPIVKIPYTQKVVTEYKESGEKKT